MVKSESSTAISPEMIQDDDDEEEGVANAAHSSTSPQVGVVPLQDNDAVETDILPKIDNSSVDFVTEEFPPDEGMHESTNESFLQHEKESLDYQDNCKGTQQNKVDIIEEEADYEQDESGAFDISTATSHDEVNETLLVSEDEALLVSDHEKAVTDGEDEEDVTKPPKVFDEGTPTQSNNDETKEREISPEKEKVMYIPALGVDSPVKSMKKKKKRKKKKRGGSSIGGSSLGGSLFKSAEMASVESFSVPGLKQAESPFTFKFNIGSQDGNNNDEKQKETTAANDEVDEKVTSDCEGNTSEEVVEVDSLEGEKEWDDLGAESELEPKPISEPEHEPEPESEHEPELAEPGYSANAENAEHDEANKSEEEDPGQELPKFSDLKRSLCSTEEDFAEEQEHFDDDENTAEIAEDYPSDESSDGEESTTDFLEAALNLTSDQIDLIPQEDHMMAMTALHAFWQEYTDKIICRNHRKLDEMETSMQMQMEMELQQATEIAVENEEKYLMLRDEFESFQMNHMKKTSDDNSKDDGEDLENQKEIENEEKNKISEEGSSNLLEEAEEECSTILLKAAEEDCLNTIIDSVKTGYTIAFEDAHQELQGMEPAAEVIQSCLRKAEVIITPALTVAMSKLMSQVYTLKFTTADTENAIETIQATMSKGHEFAISRLEKETEMKLEQQAHVFEEKLAQHLAGQIEEIKHIHLAADQQKKDTITDMVIEAVERKKKELEKGREAAILHAVKKAVKKTKKSLEHRVKEMKEEAENNAKKEREEMLTKHNAEVELLNEALEKEKRVLQIALEEKIDIQHQIALEEKKLTNQMITPQEADKETPDVANNKETKDLRAEIDYLRETLEKENEACQKALEEKAAIQEHMDSLEKKLANEMNLYEEAEKESTANTQGTTDLQVEIDYLRKMLETETEACQKALKEKASIQENIDSLVATHTEEMGYFRLESEKELIDFKNQVAEEADAQEKKDSLAIQAIMDSMIEKHTNEMNLLRDDMKKEKQKYQQIADEMATTQESLDYLTKKHSAEVKLGQDKLEKGKRAYGNALTERDAVQESLDSLKTVHATEVKLLGENLEKGKQAFGNALAERDAVQETLDSLKTEHAAEVRSLGEKLEKEKQAYEKVLAEKDAVEETLKVTRTEIVDNSQKDELKSESSETAIELRIEEELTQQKKALVEVHALEIEEVKLQVMDEQKSVAKKVVEMLSKKNEEESKERCASHSSALSKIKDEHAKTLTELDETQAALKEQEETFTQLGQKQNEEKTAMSQKISDGQSHLSDVKEENSRILNELNEMRVAMINHEDTIAFLREELLSESNTDQDSPREENENVKEKKALIDAKDDNNDIDFFGSVLKEYEDTIDNVEKALSQEPSVDIQEQLSCRSASKEKCPQEKKVTYEKENGKDFSGDRLKEYAETVDAVDQSLKTSAKKDLNTEDLSQKTSAENDLNTIDLSENDLKTVDLSLKTSVENDLQEVQVLMDFNDKGNELEIVPENCAVDVKTPSRNIVAGNGATPYKSEKKSVAMSKTPEKGGTPSRTVLLSSATQQHWDALSPMTAASHTSPGMKKILKEDKSTREKNDDVKSNGKQSSVRGTGMNVSSPAASVSRIRQTRKARSSIGSTSRTNRKAVSPTSVSSGRSRLSTPNKQKIKTTSTVTDSAQSKVSVARSRVSGTRSQVGSSSRTSMTSAEGDVRVMILSGPITDILRKMVKSLGAEFVENIEDAASATVVIAGDADHRLRRTPKLMITLCCTSHIVHMGWLLQSYKERKLLSCSHFLLLSDRAAEQYYSFSMEQTLRNGQQRRTEGGLLNGWCVYFCKDVAGKKAPKEEELRLMVEAGNGIFLESLPVPSTIDSSRVLVITSDPASSEQVSDLEAAHAAKEGAGFFTTNWLFSCFIHQMLTGLKRGLNN